MTWQRKPNDQIIATSANLLDWETLEAASYRLPLNRVNASNKDNKTYQPFRSNQLYLVFSLTLYSMLGLPYRTGLVTIIGFSDRFDEYWGEFTEFKRTDFQLE